MVTPSRPLRRRLSQAFFGLIISGLLLGVVASQLDTTSAFRRLSSARWDWIGGGFLCAVGLVLARGIRFRLLTQRSSLMVVISAITVQTFINRIAPFRLGELTLPYFLHRATREPAVPAIVSLLLVRVLELWVLVFAAIFAVIGWFGIGEGHLVALWITGSVLTVALFGFRFWIKLGFRGAAMVTRMLQLEDAKLLRGLMDQMAEVLDDTERLSRTQMVALLWTSVFVLVFTVATYDCILRSLGFELDLLQVVIGVAVASVAGAIPVLSVGSFGTHETGWTAGFAWVGLTVSDAVLSGLVTQVLTLVFNLLMAPFGYLVLLAAYRAAKPLEEENGSSDFDGEPSPGTKPDVTAGGHPRNCA